MVKWFYTKVIFNRNAKDWIYDKKTRDKTVVTSFCVISLCGDICNGDI